MYMDAMEKSKNIKSINIQNISKWFFNTDPSEASLLEFII